MKNGFVIEMDTKRATIFTSDCELIRINREPDMYIGKEISGAKQSRFSGTQNSKRRLVLLTVLAVILTASSVVLAVDHFTDGNLFYNIFRVAESDKSLTYLDGMGQLVNDAKTVDGVKVNLSAIIGDDNLIYVLLDVTAPEGTNLSSGCRFAESNINLLPNSSGGGHFGLTDKPVGNKAQFGFSFNTSSIESSKYVVIQLNDFYVGSSKLATGTWQFEVKIDYPDVTKSFLFPASNNIIFEEGTLYSLTLSPIQVEIHFDPYICSSENPSGSPIKKSPSLQVIMKDGSIIYLGSSTGSVNSDGNSSQSTFSYEFSKPINVNDVTSFQIDGKIIDVTQLTKQSK